MKKILNKIIDQYKKEKPTKKIIFSLLVATIILLGIYSHAQYDELKKTKSELESTQKKLTDTQTELDETKSQIGVCREAQSEISQIYVDTLGVFSRLGEFLFAPEGTMEAAMEAATYGMDGTIEKARECDPAFSSKISIDY